MFYYYQKLIALRKSHEVFRSGRFTLLLPEDEQRFVYRRDTENEHMLVICNFSGEEATLQDIELPAAAPTVCNYKECADTLKPYEARMYIF